MMSDDSAIAFLSYVRADDEHDHGRISALRERLEGEMRMHTGKSFKIFQDKSDIKWGQNWQNRLDGTLLSATFLIPIVTLAYFYSTACRDEFSKFLLRERQLGENSLILPIYYLEADAIKEASADGGDEIAKVLASRNWADWRSLRFKSLTSQDVESAIAEMARTIKGAMKELEVVIAASNIVSAPPPPPPPPEAPSRITEKLHGDFSPLVPTLRFGTSKRFVRSRSIDTSLYHVYTKMYDEEIHAEDLSSKDELFKLSNYLNRSIALIKKNNKNEIENMSKYLKGVQKDVSITIVVDNSGSMRGAKILYAASWAYLISSMLEVQRIPVEVLGFTTKAWKGGLSRERWLEDGKPAEPGRLNDLRHIIYKDFQSNSRSSLRNFGLMIREGILKENIDGEALLWACDRANNHGSPKKLIIVISDGVPVDDSTLTVNPNNFLWRHLSDVAKWIESQDDFGVVGIGIESEFDIGKIYKSSVNVDSLSTLGSALIEAVQVAIG